MRGCTAGFCANRENCANYIEGKTNDDVRLCGYGREQPEPLSYVSRFVNSPAEPEAISA